MRRSLQTLALAGALALGCSAADAQSSVGASTPFHLVAANSTNSTLISPGNHSVYSIELSGIGTSPAYVKLYDKATAPTCGTDTPIKTLMIPVASTAANGAGSNISFAGGLQVANGLGMCITAGISDSDTTAVAASSFVANVDYK